jgi:hypothetical protein
MRLLIISTLILCMTLPISVQANDLGLDTVLSRYAVKRDLSDWEAIVLGLNEVPIKTPLFATPYFKRIEKEITEKKGEYRLATDYARLVLVYKSHKKNPEDIMGYDFINKIISFGNMEIQGLNAYIWSLIALHGQPLEITQPFIKSILSYQTVKGGFSTAPSTAGLRVDDIDLTAMTITALALYREYNTVSDAINNAITFLSETQQTDGGYKTFGKSNAESVSQVIIALCSVGIDINDPRFVKNGNTALDALLSFQLADSTFAHAPHSDKSDPIATRQAVLALTAINKAGNGEWIFE